MEDLKIMHTLDLVSDISIHYAISKEQLQGFDMETAYIEFGYGIYEGCDYIDSQVIRVKAEDRGDYYYFTFPGLNAVMMNDSIQAVFYGVKDGVAYYSDYDYYSVAAYAYSRLSGASSPEGLKTLCADLLRYGALAQSYKGYRTDALADSAMTDAHRAYLTNLNTLSFDDVNKTTAQPANATVAWAGKALVMDSKITIRYVVDLTNYEGEISDLTLQVTYVNYKGETCNTTLPAPALYNGAKNYYAFDFTELPAAELRQPVACAVYEGGRRVSSVIQYSVSTYGNGKTGELLTLCKALIAYSDSTKAYFVK